MSGGQKKDCIYFYAEINQKSVLKLITALHEANKYVLDTCYDVKYCEIYLE